MAIDFKDGIAVPSISINGASLGTLAFSSATIPTNNNQLSNGAGYVTSSGNTTIGINQNTTLNTSTVLATLNFTNGVATSATTRTLTLGNLGFTGANNANYITNNNQLTNGAGYTTNTGTVTGVTATSPVVSSGGAAPIISMPAATSSTNGYLTSTNWQTFNNKTSNTGTITNVIAGTGITGGGTSGAVTVNTSILSLFSMFTCSTTTITSASNGVGNAVVMKFDTEAVSYGATGGMEIFGSSGFPSLEGSSYSILIKADSDNIRYFEFQWNVTSEPNTVINRILSGIRLQNGVLTEEGTLLSWNTMDPTYSYIYDRGAGTLRKGSTAGSIIIQVPTSESNTFYRMQFWRESASNGSTKSESVLNGTQWTVKQLI